MTRLEDLGPKFYCRINLNFKLVFILCQDLPVLKPQHYLKFIFYQNGTIKRINDCLNFPAPWSFTMSSFPTAKIPRAKIWVESREFYFLADKVVNLIHAMLGLHKNRKNNISNKIDVPRLRKNTGFCHKSEGSTCTFTA